MTIDVDDVLSLLIQLAALIAALAAGYAWVRRWVRQVAQDSRKAAQDSRETAKQLQTSNGHTIGQYVEESHKTLADLSAGVAESRAIAQDALTLARHNSDRLDQHLITHTQPSSIGGRS